MAQFTIRIPDELREALRAAGAEAKRSLNGQIEHILQEWVDQGPREHNVLEMHVKKFVFPSELAEYLSKHEEEDKR